LPERKADHRDRAGAPALIVRDGKSTTQRRLNREYIKEVSADPQPWHSARFSSGCQIELIGAPREQSGQGLLPVTNLLPDRVRNRRAYTDESAASACHSFGADLDELLWSRNRKSAEPDCVDQVEDRCVGSDSQR